MFTDRLCGVIQVNQAVLQDVPFIIISLQLMVSLQRLRKVNTNFKDRKKKSDCLKVSGERSLHTFLRLLLSVLSDSDPLGGGHGDQHRHDGQATSF